MQNPMVTRRTMLGALALPWLTGCSSPLPLVAVRSLRAAVSPVVPLEIGGRSYSVAFGPIQDASGRRVYASGSPWQMNAPQ